jgi:hypothetical protein
VKNMSSESINGSLHTHILQRREESLDVRMQLWTLLDIILAISASSSVLKICFTSASSVSIMKLCDMLFAWLLYEIASAWEQNN